MSAHTPGPWRASGCYVKHVGGDLLEETIATTAYAGGTVEERFANAELIARLPEMAARIAELERENICDACAGTGEPLRNGRPCMCGGTGKMSDAARYLRGETRRLRAKLERVEALDSEANSSGDAPLLYRMLDAIPDPPNGRTTSSEQCCAEYGFYFLAKLLRKALRDEPESGQPPVDNCEAGP